MGGYKATPTPTQGGVEDDRTSVEFYGSGFDPSNDGEKTGTFTLGTGADANYKSCSRCVVLFVDPSIPGKTLFQKSGTLVVDAASDQLNGNVSATLTDVTLVEVTIDPNTFASTEVPGGACVHIASAQLSATNAVPAGWTCDPNYYADGASCDCGCGAPDVDCANATLGACDFCDDSGSCNAAACPGKIDPTNNAVCTP